MNLRQSIRKFLGIKIHKDPVDYTVVSTDQFDGYQRQLIHYKSYEGDLIPAYLFIPSKKKAALLVHHQHKGQRHLGKSEVAGLAGDPFQHFCAPLCKLGYLILAPDSISFEDRRTNKSGIEKDEDEDNDFLQHYNEMAYRLLKGDLLMKKVIEDSSIGISLLKHWKGQKINDIGILGHSYGGNTVLFHAALDKRIKFSCSSGAVCSYHNKLQNNTGIEMAEVIPGFLKRFEILDLLKCICPRKLLILSCSTDIYAQDAPELYEKVRTDYRNKGKESALELKHYIGGHPLDQERFNAIIGWFEKNVM